MDSNCSGLKTRIDDLTKQNQKLQQQLKTLRSHQDQNDELLNFERLISELSTQLIDPPSNDIQKPIEYGLKMMSEFLDADQVLVLERSKDSDAKTSYGYRRDNRSFVLPKSLRTTFPFTTKKMDNGQILIFKKLPDDIPSEAEVDRSNCIKFGFKAVIGVPLMVNEAVIGSVFCYSFTEHRDWNMAIAPRLRLFGELISNAINRHRSEMSLKAAFTEIQNLNEQLRAENIYLQEEIKLKQRHPDIVGKSRAITRVLNLIEQVAETNATVMIGGETGTGKELVAHAVHKLSQRKDRAMVTLNCAALPPNLVESELFGHEKGAFTGALTQRKGRFETAHGSTIFLDEIDSLSLETQSKLLRVLQQGTFERLGSTTSMTVDVRVIAASNKDLSQAIAAGTFREDLFYRLNVFPIIVPPLRRRVEDIPLLVGEFVSTMSKQMGKNINTIPQKSMDMLKEHPWPGNVRELQNVIERAVIISRGNSLMIPQLVSSSSRHSEEILTLDDVQRRHILNTLKNTGWRVSGRSGAAKILDVNPKTLEYRMKKLGIHRPNKNP